MQCAMELLQQLYVDVTEKTGHMISRTLFRQLTLGLVSHGGKKCLKEDGQSQQYKKEALLMLTCLKVMLESEMEEENLQGKKEDTGSERKKTFIIVQPLFEELVAVDILSVLLDLIDDQDKLISYAACKALTTAVRCESFSERRETLIQDILSRVMRCDTSSRVAPFLDLLKHFMSNRSGEKINAWCLHTLISSQIFRKEFLGNIFTNIDKNSIDKPVALLTLLQKSVKYLNKLDKEQKQGHLQVLFSNIQEDLLSFLISCLQSVNQSHWRILCKRTLDIFHTLFNYGSHLAQQKEIPSHYSQTASRVLSVVCPSVKSVPYIREFVGFGGSLVEKSDDEDCQGDLSLIRKLLLVLLKSCAILMRTKTTSCSDSDRDLVSMCLVSLMQMMTKTFPSTHSHADFQWLPLVFADQDDAWVEALLCLLDVYLNSPRLSATSGICSQTNPHPLFLQFLDSNSSDHMVIVDLLTSPETCFLLYLLRYLKCVVCEWDQFTNTCHRMFPHKHSCSKKMDNSDSSDSSSKDISEIPALASSQDENVLAENNVDFCTPATKKIRLNSSWQDKEKNTLRSCDNLTKNNVVSTGTGVVSLTVYSDSESSAEEDSSSVYPATRGTELSDNNLDKSKSYCDHSDRAENKTVTSISEWKVFSQDIGSANLNSFFSYSDHPPDGSIKSCDLQCVEFVLGTFIRARLRIERLSEQKLFPYNPDPLLTLLERCETLYENMEPNHGGMQ